MAKKYEWGIADYLALGALTVGVGFIAALCVGVALKEKQLQEQGQPMVIPLF